MNLCSKFQPNKTMEKFKIRGKGLGERAVGIQEGRGGDFGKKMQASQMPFQNGTFPN